MRMSSQELMASLVSQDRYKGEIFRVGIALECLSIDSQQVLLPGASLPGLRTACLAVDMSVLDVSHESKAPRNADSPVTSCVPLRSRQGPW